MSIPASLRTRRRLVVALLVLGVAVTFATATAAGSVADPTTAANASGATEASTGADVAAPENRTLVVADTETDEHLLEIPVAEGDEVTLAYVHSVEKTPIEDVYAINGTDLFMDRTVFSSYGAGLPSEASVNRTDDGFVVSVDQSFERIHVAPGSIAGHVLQVEDRCYDLVELSGGSSVTLFVEDRGVETAPGSSCERGDIAGDDEECS